MSSSLFSSFKKIQNVNQVFSQIHARAAYLFLIVLLLFFFYLIKMEYSVFKVEEKKDGRRNLFARAGLYKSWQYFRRMCAFSLFKNKGI